MSTAVQNAALGHETPVSEEVAPKLFGELHAAPLHSEMPPEADTQKLEETHEIADTDPQSPAVRCQVCPLNSKEFPTPSTAAQ